MPSFGDIGPKNHYDIFLRREEGGGGRKTGIKEEIRARKSEGPLEGPERGFMKTEVKGTKACVARQLIVRFPVGPYSAMGGPKKD